MTPEQEPRVEVSPGQTIHQEWVKVMQNDVAAKYAYDQAKSMGLDHEESLKASVIALAKSNATYTRRLNELYLKAEKAATLGE